MGAAPASLRSCLPSQPLMGGRSSRRRRQSLLALLALGVARHDAFHLFRRPGGRLRVRRSHRPPLPVASPAAARPTEEAPRRPPTGARTPQRRLLDSCRDTSQLPAIVAQSNMTARLWNEALQACAASGDLATAERLLPQVTEPNVRHYTTYLKALLWDPSRLPMALDFLDLMTERGHIHRRDAWQGLVPIPPDFVTMRTVLSACQSNHTAAMEILRNMQQGHYGDAVLYPDEPCYNLVVASCEAPPQALALVKEMRMTRRYRVGVAAPTARTVTQALVVCRRARDVATARALVKQAGMDGIAPDVYLYAAAIATAASAGDGRAAGYFWSDMRSKRVAPNVVAYNSMLAAYAPGDDVEQAVKLFRHMNVPATRTTFGYLARILSPIPDNVMKLLHLHSIIDSMSDRDWQVWIGGPIIEMVISTYGALGCYAEAREYFDNIRGPVDAACLRAMLFACSTAQPRPEWQEALTLLHTSDAVEGTRAPKYMDAMALSHTMLACSKADEWEESLNLLRLYGDNQTSIFAINSLIGACGRAGRPDMAVELLNEMDIDYGILPDVYSYRNAIIACNQAEHEKHRVDRRDRLQKNDAWKDPLTVTFEWWECALSLLRRMREQGIEPDTQSYSSTISACEAAGEWQHALVVLQSLLDSKHPSALNLYCFNAAISACEKGGAWIEALEIYERMKAYGGRRLQPSVVTLNSLILAVDNAGQKAMAQNIYEEGIETGTLQPWRSTYGPTGEKLLALDLHRYNSAMARAAVRSHLESLLADDGCHQSEEEEDLTIIVGQGKHSSDDPVLSSVVAELLRSDYGLKSATVWDNPGRLVVTRDELKRFKAKRTWK